MRAFSWGFWGAPVGRLRLALKPACGHAHTPAAARTHPAAQPGSSARPAPCPPRGRAPPGSHAKTQRREGEEEEWKICCRGETIVQLSTKETTKFRLLSRAASAAAVGVSRNVANWSWSLLSRAWRACPATKKNGFSVAQQKTPVRGSSERPRNKHFTRKKNGFQNICTRIHF